MMNCKEYAEHLKLNIGRPVKVYDKAPKQDAGEPRYGTYMGTSTRYNGSDYIAFDTGRGLKFEDVSDDRWVFNDGDEPTWNKEFHSKFDIGDPVWLQLFDKSKVMREGVMGWIRYVTFTTGKVRYGVLIDGIETTIHNIDSIFVEERNGEKIKFEFDNLS